MRAQYNSLTKYILFFPVCRWLILRLNGRFTCKEHDARQKGRPELAPQLDARPFWDTFGLEWIRQLEEAYPSIRKEVLELRGHGGTDVFQPYRAPSCHSKGKGLKLAQDGIGAMAHEGG